MYSDYPANSVCSDKASSQTSSNSVSQLRQVVNEAAAKQAIQSPSSSTSAPRTSNSTENIDSSSRLNSQLNSQRDRDTDEDKKNTKKEPILASAAVDEPTLEVHLPANLQNSANDIGRHIQMFSFRLNRWETITLGNYDDKNKLHFCQMPDGHSVWVDLKKKPIRAVPMDGEKELED